MDHEDVPDGVLILNLEDGRELILNRECYGLYTFVGAAAIYDHVYIDHTPADGSNTCTVVFRELVTERYEALKAHIEATKGKQILNMSEPTEFDIKAFEKVAAGTIDVDLGKLLSED